MSDTATNESLDDFDTLSLSSTTIIPRTFNIRPEDGATCRIILETDDDVKLEYDVGKVIEFYIGDSESSVGDMIEENLKNLKTGEECSFELPCEKDLNMEEDNKNESKTGKVSVKLCSFENCAPVYQLSSEGKFERAKLHKENGVELFKRGKVEYAFRRFSKAQKLLISILPKDDIPAEYKTLKVQCYANLAACQLKYGSFDYVVKNCTKALEIDPRNTKCIYRRAEAYYNIKDYDLCSKDVKQGLILEPKSKTFRDLERRLNAISQS